MVDMGVVHKQSTCTLLFDVLEPMVDMSPLDPGQTCASRWMM